ncbi:hypothetical protein GCM10020358_27780 [Amorphoplanes nipponensis]|uniref:Uncharacterized protein n=1 Tax=Actinoplanes nipponensis TaxID=135950 RepID=A0A919MIK0_9ACTN|nr:hypothetical protein [Actinoplanes nipponensis]GIE46491.1 hypothetical protein Ani05nite_00250 [Actinoplanes nipponensis]
MAETELGRLAEIAAARAGLDARELELIDRARQAGATWGQVAGALGLASRQAAEQRRQRLVAAARSRRHVQDLRYAPAIVTLRAAVDDLHRSIAADRRWPARFPRAALVRATVQAALDAPPGGLYALAVQADEDLVTAPVPGYVRVAAAALHRALSMDC